MTSVTANQATKCGRVALIGAPNAGKSTLTNFLAGQKISIVSPKPQTTRNAIRAIFIENHSQIILVDTPGIFIPRKQRILERAIVKAAWQALKEADIICLVIDAKSGFNSEVKLILEDLKQHSLKPIIALNKIDAIRKEHLLTLTSKLLSYEPDKIFMVSALNGDGVVDLKNYLLSLMPEAPWLFGSEEISDAPVKFLASEITREKLFLNLNQDLPYALTVKNENWQVLNNGQVKIHQTIYVLKESQKSIIVGKHGNMIKKVGQEARKDIEELLGVKAHLYLFVKVKKDWMNDSETYSLNS